MSMNSKLKPLNKHLAALLLAFAALATTSAQAQVQLTNTYAIPASAVDKSKTGFLVRTWQSPGEPNTIVWAEEQLAGLHGTNMVDLTTFTDSVYGNKYFDETGVIDYWNSGGQGNFPN